MSIYTLAQSGMSQDEAYDVYRLVNSGSQHRAYYNDRVLYVNHNGYLYVCFNTKSVDGFLDPTNPRWIKHDNPDAGQYTLPHYIVKIPTSVFRFIQSKFKNVLPNGIHINELSMARVIVDTTLSIHFHIFITGHPQYSIDYIMGLSPMEHTISIHAGQQVIESKSTAVPKYTPYIDKDWLLH